jgi:hypothetical protein
MDFNGWKRGNICSVGTVDTLFCLLDNYVLYVYVKYSYAKMMTYYFWLLSVIILNKCLEVVLKMIMCNYFVVWKWFVDSNIQIDSVIKDTLDKIRKQICSKNISRKRKMNNCWINLHFLEMIANYRKGNQVKEFSIWFMQKCFILFL